MKSLAEKNAAAANTDLSGYGSIYDDGTGDVEINPAIKKPLKFTKEEAKQILGHNLQKHIQKKPNKQIIKDYQYGRDLSRMSNDLTKEIGITLEPLRRGNDKVIGIQYNIATPEKERVYSAGLDVALPTPLKLEYTQRKGVRNSSTQKRAPGRTPESAYKIGKASRFSSGEMTNPLF